MIGSGITPFALAMRARYSAASGGGGDTTAPQPASTFTATAAGTDQVTLAWTGPVDADRTGYVVERSLDGSAGWTALAGSPDGSYALGNGWIASATFPQWVQVQVDIPIAVAQYALSGYPTATSPEPRSPSWWKLEGSNDGASWTLLDSRSGIAWAGHDFTTPKVFSVGALLRDTFTDTDGTSVADHAPEEDASAAGWTVDDGFTITSNRAVPTTSASAMRTDQGVVDAALTVVGRLNAVGGSNMLRAILHRASATEYWEARIESSGSISIREVTGGSTVIRASRSGASDPALIAGTDYTLRAWSKGTTMYAARGAGAPISPTMTSNLTATGAAIFGDNSAGGMSIDSVTITGLSEA